MEKNNTIKILLSIVLTVIVFVVVCLWLFYPRNTIVTATQPAPIQYVQGAGTINPTEAVASPAVATNTGTPGDAQAQPGIINQNVLVVDGNTANGTTPAYTMGKDGRLIRVAGTPGQQASAADAQPPSASIPGGESAVSSGVPGAEVKTGNGVVVSAGSQRKATVETGDRKPAEATKPAGSAKPAASTKPTAKPSPAAKAEAVNKSGKDYWIQVISTTSKDRVEQVRKDLSALGFNGRVVAFNKDGVDFYRLRYGPYAQRAEALKFLDWVKMIKGMEGSFVAEESVGPAAAKPAKPAAVPAAKPSASPISNP